MREVGVHNFKIVPLLTFACNRETIYEFEQEWVKVLGANLNTFSTIDVDPARRGYNIKRRKRDKETKRYYCELCNVACTDSFKLKRHFDTLKHSYAWLNSLD